MAFSDYSTTPSANTSIAGINLAEGCNASGINDAIRQLMADAATFAGQSAMPSGSIQAFAGATPPSGWLLCDGSAVSRTTYAALFDVVGTTNGAGDGSTTFNLPDFRGKVIVGAGGGYTLGATGGEATHTLTTAEVPSEAVSVSGSVTISGTTGTGGGHTHTLTDPGHSHTVAIGYTGAGTTGAVSGASPTGSYNESTTTATTGITLGSVADHTHSFSGTSTISASGSTSGAGGAHNNMQPYGVANVIIKT